MTSIIVVQFQYALLYYHIAVVYSV